MSTFTDDFNRANGALGGNWTVIVAGLSISGARAVSSSLSYAYNSTLSDAGDHYAMAHVLWTPNANSMGGPAVKFPGGNGNCYFASIIGGSAPYTFGIRKRSGTTQNVIASTSITGTPNPFNKLTIEWVNGHLTATMNDEYTVEVDDIDYANGTLCGMMAAFSYVQLDDVYFSLGAAVGLAVSPEAIGNYGACSTVYLTGTGTAWTAGTPGSPTFTVDHGTISAQTVVDETHATLTYCPGDYLGPVIFTDPSTGMTAGALVSSDPDIVPPGDLCPFNPDFIAMANATGLTRTPDLLMTENITIPLEPAISLLQAVSLIWINLRAVTGGIVDPENWVDVFTSLSAIQNNVAGQWDPGQVAFEPLTSTPIKSDTENTLALFWNEAGERYYTIQDIINASGGGGGVDLTEVRNDIGIVNQETWTNLVQILLGMWGPGASTLTTLGLELDELRGSPNWTLGDVISQLRGSISGMDLSDLYNLLVAIRGDATTTLASLKAQLVAALAAISANAQLIEDLEDAEAVRYNNIMTRLDTIEGKLDALASAPGGAPVYPGFAGVTFGPELVLENTVIVPGPMHGVTVSITGCEGGTRFFQYDTIKSWSHVGALVFCNDLGQAEPFQTLGFQDAIYSPKTLAVAGSCRLFRSRNVRGTIRPWTLNSA